MKTVIGDLFKFHEQGKWICITTNGFVKKNGECVMGRGVAKQTSIKYNYFPKFLGERILETGNHVYCFVNEHIFTFPVKHYWWEAADIELIRCSVIELVSLVNNYHYECEDVGMIQEVYLPKPGCGNGKLRWEDVKPVIEPILDNRFIVVDYK